MDNFLENLLDSAQGENAFKPVARYFSAMDSLVYLKEDLSYRADRVDGRLTLLWHPYEENLVGIKLKGFKYMFTTLNSIADMNLKEEHFIPIVKYLELAMFGVAGAMMDNYEEEGRERIKQKYEEAKVFVGEAIVPVEEELLDLVA